MHIHTHTNIHTNTYTRYHVSLRETVLPVFIVLISSLLIHNGKYSDLYMIVILYICMFS